MTGTQIAYYFLCKRKLWLFSNHLDMEQTSDTVAMGRVISENTYKRVEHEIKIDSVMLDFYDEKKKVIHEVKKSDKMEETHMWQVKYYISVLEAKGIEGVTGEIDYPKLRQKVEVKLTQQDRVKIKEIELEIENVAKQKLPPVVIDKPFCKECSYFDLCYV